MATTAKKRRAAESALDQAAADAVALYARVSSEDQAERETIQTQLDFLRKWCELKGLQIAGEYVDDGVSGGKPFAERPEGRRLLDDAAGGRFKTVVFFRLNRFGRTLANVLAGQVQLDDLGVEIQSATEPFDTTTALGRLMFQLLGSLAEFDRENLAESFTLGRDRVAKTGRYTGGPIGFGYDLDGDNCFVPAATRAIAQLPGMTEFGLLVELFTAVADRGATAGGEAARLNALGVPRTTRYGGEEKTSHARWTTTSIASLLHNPMYKGEATLDSRYGEVCRAIPALVDAALWERAQTALAANTKNATRNGKQTYHLRGLVRCGHCGGAYHGAMIHGRPKYRCEATTGRADRGHRCAARQVHEGELELRVWDGCARVLGDPAAALAETRDRLRGRLGQASEIAARHAAVGQALAGKDAERETILRLHRKGTIRGDEAEKQLDEIAAEAAMLRATLERERAQVRLIESEEARFTEGATLFGRYARELAEIEARDDWGRRRWIMRRLIRQIVVRWEGGSWTADVTMMVDGAGDAIAARGSGDGVVALATPSPTQLNYSIAARAA